ncbi:probable transmembrane ascorbate ferrireductase 3 [Gastrolobium bilobum]|uniref:probable transmembrane ascorbate ferrireductase 3 n=1 Tax=Gastrolobium bilobum TaxID=150636 RepID=UPI002AB071C5|nr:probable transmembrane ascorbate ferrireductase 3 [Gastrolobium bilobum]
MSSLGISGFAHLFGVLAIILLLVWLLHYREGIDFDSDNGFRVFNVHPLMMFTGFIFLVGEAAMAFETVPGLRQTKKFVHMTLHLTAIILGIVGLCAVFKFHDMAHIVNVYSLHSWIGIGTFCLFGLQWLFGFVTFMIPGPSAPTRTRMLHRAFGKALLFMAVCAAETGLMEKSSFLNLKPHQREYHLINFTGLAILLFGVFVDFSINFRNFA